MMIKRTVTLFLAAFLTLTLAACSHKKPPCGVGVPHGGVGSYENGAETYAEGMGPEGANCYTESSKCRPGRRVAHAEQHYFFDFDSNDVRSVDVESIHLQANYLLKHPNTKIRLEGNTDDRGSREYNITLGERRARAVLEILKQSGVSSSQVSVISYGAEKPAAGGEDEQSYQCNRRVDLIYIN